MTDEEYQALAAKAVAGTLTDEERESLDTEARARVDAAYASQVEGA